MKLYARALDKLLREHEDKGSLTDEDIERIASNGTRIIENIRNQTYTSKNFSLHLIVF